jgi:hypothetical protein
MSTGPPEVDEATYRRQLRFPFTAPLKEMAHPSWLCSRLNSGGSAGRHRFIVVVSERAHLAKLDEQLVSCVARSAIAEKEKKPPTLRDSNDTLGAGR